MQPSSRLALRTNPSFKSTVVRSAPYIELYPAHLMRKLFLSAAFLLSALTANAQVLSAEEAFQRGADLAEAGEHARALPLFQAALRTFPDNPSILWNLGVSSSELGDHVQALNYWNSYPAQSQTDWRAHAKLVQVYQALGDLRSRDPARSKLLEMRQTAEAGSDLAQATVFCREQTTIRGLRVMAFETFEPTGDRKVFYTFYALNAVGKESFRVSLGSYEVTNKIAWEIGDLPRTKRLFHLDRYEGTSHMTLGFFESMPSYDSIRTLFLQASDGKIQPLSASTRR